MAVIVKEQERKWGSYAPYHITTLEEFESGSQKFSSFDETKKAIINNNRLNIESWIEDFNSLVGGDPLLKLKTEDDSDYIKINPFNTFTASDKIGKFAGLGEHEIGMKDRRTFYHELLHVLGFAHEQYHKHYPWDRNDPALTAEDVKQRKSFKVYTKPEPSSKTSKVEEPKKTDYNFLEWHMANRKKNELEKGNKNNKESKTINSLLKGENLIKGKTNKSLFDKLKLAYGSNFDFEIQLFPLYRHNLINVKEAFNESWKFSVKCDFNSVMMYSKSFLSESFIEKSLESSKWKGKYIPLSGQPLKVFEAMEKGNKDATKIENSRRTLSDHDILAINSVFNRLEDEEENVFEPTQEQMEEVTDTTLVSYLMGIHQARSRSDSEEEVGENII